MKELHECGKASLRRTQFKIAEKGNANMAIFLGKQYLGQTDKAEQTNIERVAIVYDMPQEDDEEEWKQNIYHYINWLAKVIHEVIGEIVIVGIEHLREQEILKNLGYYVALKLSIRLYPMNVGILL